MSYTLSTVFCNCSGVKKGGANETLLILLLQNDKWYVGGQISVSLFLGSSLNRSFRFASYRAIGPSNQLRQAMLRRYFSRLLLLLPPAAASLARRCCFSRLLLLRLLLLPTASSLLACCWCFFSLLLLLFRVLLLFLACCYCCFSRLLFSVSVHITRDCLISVPVL